jgi:uncharacterized coiled-coil DUF342 family protein
MIELNKDQNPKLEELKKEFAQLCAETGSISYQISVLEEQLEANHRKLKEVNHKAAELNKEPEAPQPPEAA